MFGLFGFRNESSAFSNLQHGSGSLGSYVTVRMELKILATKLKLGFLFSYDVLVMLHFHVFRKLKLV